jgi:hypothetical protein
MAPDVFDRAVARIRELGWYAKFQPEPDGMMAQVEQFEALDIPVLLDHMGRADPGAGAADPTRRKLESLLARGNFWVMLSLTEKLSRTGEPWDDVIPLAQALIAANPDRVVWGSDWPHPVSVKATPNEGHLLDQLARYLLIAADGDGCGVFLGTGVGHPRHFHRRAAAYHHDDGVYRHRQFQPRGFKKLICSILEVHDGKQYSQEARIACLDRHGGGFDDRRRDFLPAQNLWRRDRRGWRRDRVDHCRRGHVHAGAGIPVAGRTQART